MLECRKKVSFCVTHSSSDPRFAPYFVALAAVEDTLCEFVESWVWVETWLSLVKMNLSCDQLGKKSQARDAFVLPKISDGVCAEVEAITSHSYAQLEQRVGAVLREEQHPQR